MEKTIRRAHHPHSRALLNALIRTQNDLLLQGLAEKYDLDIDELRGKYLTPSFYDVTYSSDNVYNTVFVDKTTKEKSKIKEQDKRE